MEEIKPDYFHLEDEYSKLCKTNSLVQQVIALREEVPKLYQGLLKQEAKIWASKLQHPEINFNSKIATQKYAEKLGETIFYVDKCVNQTDLLGNEINYKSTEITQTYETIVKECEELSKIKPQLLTLRKQSNLKLSFSIEIDNSYLKIT